MKLELTAQELSIIINALAKEPFKDVYLLINKLQAQAVEAEKEEKE